MLTQEDRRAIVSDVLLSLARALKRADYCENCRAQNAHDCCDNPAVLGRLIDVLVEESKSTKLD